jgi:hypothetical protein
MARPKKQTVDYFPHLCNHGKTIFILEQKYGNDGYAFWFKLLEILGNSKGHYFRVENVADWEFLQAKTHLDRDKCIEILDLLANLEAIDKTLWDEHRVVWSDNFVKNIADAYKNRRVEIPAKPNFYSKKPQQNDVSTDENPQTKLNKTKLNKTKKDNIKFTPPTPEEVIAYCQERNNNIDPQKWYDFYSAKGWMIGKNKMKDWKAAVRTWERSEKGNFQSKKPQQMTSDEATDLWLNMTEGYIP